MPRLRRSDCSGPGLHRVRRGRGFSYVDADGRRIENRLTLDRLGDLAIPPAWTDVWICEDQLGHLQATGVDAAGRKQYLYHSRWREQRDRAKFKRMERFAAALPGMRRRVATHLERTDPDREHVLACSVRLLDLGLFRVGGEEYADDDGGRGLATIGKEHVSFTNGAMVFDYPAKSGQRRVHQVHDPRCTELVRTLKRRRGGGNDLLAFRQGRRWHQIRSEDINEYVKKGMGEEFTAKDFRTWNATVLAAVALAADDREPSTKTARKRVIDDAVKSVAEVLGNTPAVARRAYIDPRVFDRYLSGWTIGATLRGVDDVEAVGERTRRRIERAVLDLLSEHEDPGALHQIAA